MQFGEVLSRAWQIIWRNKILWIFGILAGCGNASGGGSGNFRASFDREMPPEMERFFNQIPQLPDWQIAILVGLAILVILILLILAIFLGTIGRVGLIKGTLQAERGDERLFFGELFSGSLAYFWRVFGLNLLVGLAAFILALVLAVPLVFFTAVTMGLGLICLIPLICLIIPIAWFVGVIVQQAIIAIVVEDIGILDGLRQGWDIVRANLGAMIVMALILYLGVSLIGGLIIGLPIALVVAPAIVGAVAGTDQTFGSGLLITALCFVAYLPVLLVLSGILRGYIESAWTLTYLRLSEKPAAIEASPEAA